MNTLRFNNRSEGITFTKRQMAQAKLAGWHGRQAYLQGLDGIFDNPHKGWDKTLVAQHGHQCLLWCRFLLGWLREHERVRATPMEEGKV